ncbi:MAG: N-6 DNA methylase [Chitinophagaceae bacterium]|jgi:hypothetical protein
MNIKDIRDILEAPYNRNVWKEFIKTQFTNNNLLIKDSSFDLGESDLSTECYILGNYAIDEFTKIGIFEVQLKDNVKLNRNRVGLRNLIKDVTKQVAGAMVVFVKGDEWRFSYISKRKVKNKHTNLIEDKETAPKRFTYLFGKGEKALTAAQRFDTLIQKQKGNLYQHLTLDDFEAAFSVEKLSKEFFDQYKKSYEDFVEYLTGKRYKKSGNRYLEQSTNVPNSQLKSLFGNNEKQARDFCKRMMGRIVFLYFIQKKGWLAVEQHKKWGDGKMNYLYDLFDKSKDKDNFYNEELVHLFFRTLNNPNSEDEKNLLRFPYLNGGLFDDTQDNQYNKLVLPAAIFKELFDTFSNFNFTVYEDSPDEQTVAVDPEMLGHIFENLLEDNKDKGAFYTPKEIVHYMCQESIEAYLLVNDNLLVNNSEVAKSAIHKIIRQLDLDDDEKMFVDKHAYKIIDALENVKICDPAIGSGAFPMGILQEIFHTQIYLQELKGFKKDVTDADIKKHIIQESIYGIDIDEGAVDIARLRFWLSLVVDEEKPHPLPNLDYKIISGNSLVSRFGVEEPIDSVFKTLNEDRKKKGLKSIDIADYKSTMNRYLNTSDKQAKTEFKNLINEIKTAFIVTLSRKNILNVATARGEYENLLGNNLLGQKKASLTEISIAKEKLEKAEKELNEIRDGIIYKNSIEWRFQFPGILNNDGNFEGFDIVIGNPPYIKEYTNKDAFDGFRKSKYYQGKMDLWYGFACVLIDKLKQNGVQCFIAQNNWTTSAGASKLREKILTDTKILSFIDFGNYKVFASAGIQTMIYLLQKTSIKSETSYPLKYTLLINEDLKEENLGECLDFQFKTDYAQKYWFEIVPSINKQKAFTFNTNEDEVLLNEIASVANYRFSDKEVANGIHPHYDFVNKKIAEESDGILKNGEGIFGLTTEELEQLQLNKNEKELIKPYYTTDNFKRYYANPENKLWLIYTDSSFKDPKNIEPYPHIKQHLDRFENVITSDNKPYGLHRAREERFFLGEKIIVQRKCAGKPVFTYTNFNTYVSATFYVIKSFKGNHKFLTALLNSRLIEYWLRNKGKMQGNNFQLDKEPIVNIPLVIPENVAQFEILVDYLLYLYNDNKAEVLSHTDNKRIASHIESILNMLVYELYFLNHMKEVGIDISPFVAVKPLSKTMDNEEDASIIKDFYLWFQTPENPIRQRMILVETRSNDKISIINQNTI